MDFFRDSHILIYPHTGLDGDCLGSAKALQLLIEHNNGSADIMSSEKIPYQWEWLNITTVDKVPSVYDGVILVDVASPERVSVEVPKDKPILIIDHHELQEPFGDFRIVDTNAAAVGVLIDELRKNLLIPLDTLPVDYSNAILASIVSDTGGFKHDNTDGRAMQIATNMVKTGKASLKQVNENQFNNHPVDFVTFMQRGFNAMEIKNNGIVAFKIPLTFTHDLKIKPHPAELHQFASLYRNYEILYVLFENADKSIRGSLRSKNLEIMDKVAEAFGGGGHKKASGFTINNISMDDLEKQLLSEIKKHI